MLLKIAGYSHKTSFGNLTGQMQVLYRIMFLYMCKYHETFDFAKKL